MVDLSVDWASDSARLKAVVAMCEGGVDALESSVHISISHTVDIDIRFNMAMKLDCVAQKSAIWTIAITIKKTYTQAMYSTCRDGRHGHYEPYSIPHWDIHRVSESTVHVYRSVEVVVGYDGSCREPAGLT